MDLELTRAWCLWGLVALAVLVWYFRRSLVDLARWQRGLSLVLRGVIVVLLLLAASGLMRLRPTRERFVVFAVDRSLSIGEEARAKADAFVAEALEHAGSNGVAVVEFASEPGAVETSEAWQETREVQAKGGGGRHSPEPPPNRPFVREGGDGAPVVREAAEGAPDAPASPSKQQEATDLGAALEVAGAAIPPFYVPEIVVLSDGNETAGDALQSAAALAEQGVSVSTVPLPTREDPEVQVSAVEVPAQARDGEPFYVKVVVHSNHEDKGVIEVYRGAYKVASQEVKIQAGENTFQFKQSVTRDRFAEYKVRCRQFEDTLLDNNTSVGLVSISGKPRVLLVESDPAQAKHLTWALEEEDLQLDVRPPQGVPDSLADLQNYEMLILSNVPATSLSSRKMEVIRTYVQELGGGFMMLGGDQSFGLGGYYKTTLEEILPVRSDFEKEKEKPSLAMVLVIDKSGSMGGQKIELAKEAAKKAAELLSARDQLGVIAFEGETFWVSELHPASDLGYIIDRISTIEAGGGTNMAPAMDEAYQALRGAAAKLKHVIILTDGISAPGDFAGITADMASSQITVSTVGIGQGAHEELLKQIAEWGSGRFYFTDDPGAIPQIFTKETMTASKSAINELPFLPQTVRPSAAMGGIDLESAPFLLGYVITRPKPTSEVILASESGDPLLAWWRYGLGMSVAFTSDAKSRWGAEWLSWPGFGKFWAQVVRHAMRRSEAKGFHVQIEPSPGRAVVTIDAADPTRAFLNEAESALKVIDPSLATREVRVEQIAPGRYRGEFATPDEGSYHLELTQQSQGQVLYRQSRGLAVNYPEELRLRPTNEALLRGIAVATGGAYDPAPEAIFAETDTTAPRAEALWPWLLWASVWLFVVDVALRRIDLSLLLSRLRRPRAA